MLGEHNVDGGIADATSEISHRAHADVRRAISWARELDTGVVLVPFFMRAELVERRGRRAGGSRRFALCPEAAEHGVSLCFEGSLPAERIASIAARVGSDAFGCYFDLANPLAHKGWTTTTSSAARGLIEGVHVKDTRARTGDCRPGTGRVDFAECAVALFEIGYDGWLTLETPPAPPPLVSRDLEARARCSPGSTGTPLAASRRVLDRVRRGRWEHLADEIDRLGLDSVQLMGPLLDECLEDAGRAESARAVAEERGVAVPGLGGYRNLVSPDPVVRRERRARSTMPGDRSCARHLRRRNGDRDHGRKRQWTDTPRKPSEEAWGLLYDALEALLPVAEERGVILALETYVGHVLKTQGQLSGLLDRFPTEHLQVVCDPYNYLSSALV